MKKITQFLLVSVVMLFTTVVFSQSTLKGVVMDADLNTPLPGANIVEKGTSNGTVTDFDGNFSLTSQASSGEIVISYVGYSSKTISFSGNQDLGTIVLESSEVGLQEVQVFASVAVDRKTPVAVSTVKAADIDLKLGTNEFPEILKSTPGVYATKAGGGYGDGRINLRGFSSVNVAVMINGVPVNDMENGIVYWSNWAGLADVTSTMQVQRGLGASKVAVPSIGGTINILTKTTDAEEGGNVYSTLGNDGYLKYGATYSTGLMDNGFAVTVSGAKTEGDGYVDGTEFTGVSYFVNVSKQINDKHKLSFTAFGAKQNHGQRQNSQLLETYENSARGIRYNADWGYKQGQILHQEDNFYHKPQLSLNHYWTISDKTSLSTALYASFGSGGGGGYAGVNKFSIGAGGMSDYRIGNYGPVNFDKIVDENVARGADGSETVLRASRNDHKWYGLLSTLRTDLSDNLILTGGLDLRTYKGDHFQEITDLLGGQYFADDSDVNNPNAALQVGDLYGYHDDGLVGWMGLFGQLEYTKNNLAAFVSGAISNTSYKREDFFLYLDGDPLQKTDRYNFAGFSIKGGANYNLDANNNVFANLGYFEKAPGFDTVFPNFTNTDINKDAPNQKILSFELGYGLRSEKLTANLNLYRTEWKDRSLSKSYIAPDNTVRYANLTGVNALHQGIELDFVYKPVNSLRLTGMLSLGDWRWENNLENVQIYDENNQPVGSPVNVIIKDLHVGDAAQTTMALGLDYKLADKTRLTVDYNYYDRLYASFDPNGRTAEGPEAWKVPDYGIFDVTFSHGFKFGMFDATLIGRLDNVFDTHYVADAFDGPNSDALTSRVWYGFGRTFSVGAKIEF